MNRAVHRLHGRVREKRQLVGRLELARRWRGPWRCRRRTWRPRRPFRWRRADRRQMSFEADARVGAFVPGRCERFEALLRRPHVIADHRDHDRPARRPSARRDFPGGAVVDLADLAAEHRAGRDGREFHAGQHRVDAVDGLAVDLVRRVEALQRLADQHEILRVLQRRRPSAASRCSPHRPARHRQACARSPCASPRRSPSCSLPDRPAIAARRPAPAWRARWRRPCAAASRTRGSNWNCRWPGCRTSDCRRACRWAARARATTCEKSASSSSARIIAIDGVDALPHLDLRHHQRGLAGRVDADEGVGRELAVGVVRRLHRLVGRAHAEDGRRAESRPPDRRSAATRRETPSRKSFCDCHGTLLRLTFGSGALDRRADAHIGAAAADIARHRGIDVGIVRDWASLASSAAADMIWPDWQ